MSPAVFTSGGTASVQWFVATQSAFIRSAAVSPNDYYVQAGVTAVPGTADPLYLAAPQLFAPLSVVQGL